MNATDAAITGGVALAAAIVLGTIVNRMVPHGTPRRGCEEAALLLGCAAPALAVFGEYLHRHLLSGVAVVAVAYGGFYVIRMRQLRRAGRDGVRRLLGLERNASYGEALSMAERITPSPSRPTGESSWRRLRSQWWWWGSCSTGWTRRSSASPWAQPSRASGPPTTGHSPREFVTSATDA